MQTSWLNCFCICNSFITILLGCRVLLRIRMLYYIKSDIVGEFAQQVAEGIHIKLVYYNIIIFQSRDRQYKRF